MSDYELIKRMIENTLKNVDGSYIKDDRVFVDVKGEPVALIKSVVVKEFVPRETVVEQVEVKVEETQKPKPKPKATKTPRKTTKKVVPDDGPKDK